MMKVALLCSLLIASIAFAQKGHQQTGKLMTPPKGKTTPPRPINESDRDKRCPQGFQSVGKQCVQNIHAPAEVVCPPGTEQIDGKCAKIVGKRQVCPPGFEEEDGTCVRKVHASPQTHCPEGFVLVGKDEKCAKKVQEGSRATCPSGSIAKGDQCVRKVTKQPKFVCPNGFKQEGHRCVREETFDCTPPRKSSVRPTKGGGGKKGPATIEEFVLQSTCKRIISEPARKICEEGRLEGHVCILEEEVQSLVVPGRFREVFAPAMTQCPQDFSPSKGKECEKVEFARPFFVCPPSTTDLGDKCATFRAAKIVCPHGFSLENDRQCVKTIFAAPIVDFTVTFTCTGKNCAQGKDHSRT